MIDKNIPFDPKTSRFGWPQPSRVQEFQKLLTTTGTATTRVVFQGINRDLPIVRVPIELPKYRMANGRTVSLQAEYLAQNSKERADLFLGDPELWDAQAAQHLLLLQLAKQSDLQKYFEDTGNKQVDPIILDENGFVVNGNRRLSCWRELLHKEPGKYSHFRNIDIAILPHCDEKEIDRLEAALQIEKDIKAPYSWDAKANMMLAKQKRYGFSTKELGELYGMKESDVKELLDMLGYASEYLRSREQTDRWSLVSNDEFAFKRLVSSRQKITNAGTQELFKQAAFALIEKPEEAGGRLYDTIPAIAENLSAVKEKLCEEFSIIAEESVDSSDTQLDDLFGGGLSDTNISDDIQLAREIEKSENVSRVRSIIVEVIESQKQLKRDAKAEGYLLKCCSSAQSALAAGIKEGLRPESKREGVERQLIQIESQIAAIRDYLKKHA